MPTTHRKKSLTTLLAATLLATSCAAKPPAIQTRSSSDSPQSQPTPANSSTESNNHTIASKGADPSTPPVLAPAKPSPQSPLDDHVPGVVNFGFITADIWRGAKPTPEGLQTLAAMGVKTIIDLQEQDESASVPAGVKYIPMRTSSMHSDRVDTAAVLKAIEKAPKPVFIHCLEGRDRTGMVVAAYRVANGMSADDAIAELHNFRVNIWWAASMERRIEKLAENVKAAPKPAN